MNDEIKQSLIFLKLSAYYLDAHNASIVEKIISEKQNYLKGYDTRNISVTNITNTERGKVNGLFYQDMLRFFNIHSSAKEGVKDWINSSWYDYEDEKTDTYVTSFSEGFENYHGWKIESLKNELKKPETDLLILGWNKSNQIKLDILERMTNKEILQYNKIENKEKTIAYCEGMDLYFKRREALEKIQEKVKKYYKQMHVPKKYVEPIVIIYRNRVSNYDMKKIEREGLRLCRLIFIEYFKNNNKEFITEINNLKIEMYETCKQ